VVGPYETVQLKSSDSAALKSWLIDHNYNLTPDISPVVDAYVAEGFDFLAMKLVPGQGVSSMRPVRVTAPGANPALPLRMVAAGTGAVTGITLFLLGEGRYQPTNFPEFTIDPSQVIWNWDTNESNYAALQEERLRHHQRLWLAHRVGAPHLGLRSHQLAPAESPSNPRAERLRRRDGQRRGRGVQRGHRQALRQHRHELALDHPHPRRAAPRGALQRSARSAPRRANRRSRTSSRRRWPKASPPCPTYPPCDDIGDPGNGSWGGFGWPGSDGTVKGSGGGCAMGTDTQVPATVGALGVLMALSMVRRRKATKPSR
jgi:hypothetical protein